MNRGFDPRRYKVGSKDPYMDKNIYRDPTLCPNCGIIYHGKRWVKNDSIRGKLKSKKKRFYKKECPACRKVKDHYPLGVVEISFPFLDEKGSEIKNHVYNLEDREKSRNPLERIMNFKNTGDKLYIETTTEHLAKKIGNSVRKAFDGEMNVSFSSEQKFLRVLVTPKE